MPVYDALYDYKQRLEHILVRHEQGAIHAAQGYARTSGDVGVCFATSGPGATNLITGLADAMIDSTPVVCVTGQVASHLLGTDAFQETDVIGISMPVTKWNIQVTRAEDIADAIARAFYIAKSGRPGPVLVDITKDAQFGEAGFNYKKCESIRSYVPKPKLVQKDLQDAANLINAASKPYLLVGQGILLSEAEDVLLAFAEKTGIPVASTLLGLGAFPADHPLYVGYLGMHGNYAPNLQTNECDVLIAVGMRFDDRVTGDVDRYAKQAKIIHFEIVSENRVCAKNAAVPALWDATWGARFVDFSARESSSFSTARQLAWWCGPIVSLSRDSDRKKASRAPRVSSVESTASSLPAVAPEDPRSRRSRCSPSPPTRRRSAALPRPRRAPRARPRAPSRRRPRTIATPRASS